MNSIPIPIPILDPMNSIPIPILEPKFGALCLLQDKTRKNHLGSCTRCRRAGMCLLRELRRERVTSEDPQINSHRCE